MNQDKLNVLMVGPGLDVAGGISAVVNHWLAAGLRERVNLRYIRTVDRVDTRFPARKLYSAARACTAFGVDSVLRPADVVHLHLSTGASFYRKLLILEVARMRRLKTVVHLHGSRFMQFYAESSPRQARLIKRAFDGTNAIIVLSDAWREFVQSFSSNPNVHVLYNGASSAVFTPQRGGTELMISSMGRLGHRKGTWDLLEAFSRLARDVPNVRLVLGGDGELDKARALVKRHGLEHRVTIAGWLVGQEKLDVFNRTDIYALPSYHEGLPASIVEAMAAGAPIVSTPVGGIPEAVIDAHNGFLVPPGDVALLCDRLRRLCRDAELRERMGQRSRDMIGAKFDLDKLLGQLVDVYHHVLSDDRRGPRLKPAVDG